MASPITVLVADTWSGTPHANYLKAFPNARFVDHLPNGRKPTRTPHPHGGLVASRLLLPLIDEEVEVHFVPFLNDEIAPPDPLAWLLEVMDEVSLGPGDLQQNSWGADRSKLPRVEQEQYRFWQPWVRAEAALRAERGYWIGFAAGNLDTGGLTWSDVGYPARLMVGAVIAGAIDRTGRVTDFSADGLMVTGCDLGHYAYVMNPITGVWELMSGTSGSSPSMDGVVLSLVKRGLVDSYDGLIAWMVEEHDGRPNAGRPEGFTRDMLPDPKFGYGETTDECERICRAADAFNRTGLTAQRIHALLTERLRWMDFNDLSQ